MVSQILINGILVCFCGALLLVLRKLESDNKKLSAIQSSTSESVIRLGMTIGAIFESFTDEQKKQMDENFKKIVSEVEEKV